MGGLSPWFGVHETLGLTLFYHPVTSFLLPLAVVSRLFPTFGRHFPTPDWVFGNTKGAVLRRLGLLLVWGVITGYNLGKPDMVVLTWLPFLVLLWIGYLALKKNTIAMPDGPIAVTASSQILGRRAVFFASTWLALIYLSTYFYLFPEKLPPWHIQLITFGFYPLIILLIWKTGAVMKHTGLPDIPRSPAKMPAVWLLAIFLFGWLFSALLPIGGELLVSLAAVVFFGMVPLGVTLFVWLALWKVFIRP